MLQHAWAGHWQLDQAKINLVSTFASVTRLGDLLDFGQLFKGCDNNYFAQIAHILGIFCKGVNVNLSFFGQLFIDIWRLFTGHTVLRQHDAACQPVLWNDLIYVLHSSETDNHRDKEGGILKWQRLMSKLYKLHFFDKLLILSHISTRGPIMFLPKRKHYFIFSDGNNIFGGLLLQQLIFNFKKLTRFRKNKWFVFHFYK